MNRALFAAIALAFAVNTLPVDAEAAPSPPPAAVDMEVLTTMVAAELDHIAHFVGVLKQVVAAHPEAVDQAGKDAFKVGRAQWEEAKAKHKAGEHKAAYRLAHKSVRELQPAMDQILGEGLVPPELVEAVAKQLEATAKRIHC
ncbi:MAG: hypothetical protein HN348_30940 [Proteobacteria bacterium]|jgi:hypothetical protein|nr:hypothetical protein [Pseudomonadota bacterium]